MTDHRPTRIEMDAAVLQERQAYQEMRTLIPDLHLPAAQRAPYDRQQANAVANYEHARERVRLLRAWRAATRPDSDFALDITDVDPEG